MAGTKIGSLFGDVSLRTAQLDKDIALAGKKLKKFGAGMTSLGKDLSASVTAPIVGIGAAALISFGNFEKGMNEVRSLLPNLNQGEFVQLQEDVRNLSVEMGVNALEATQALYQAISAGVPKDNAIDFLRVASKSAIAGVTDVETSVNALTGVLNAYKRSSADAEEVADVLFTTVRLGKTTFAEIGASISNVAPLAAALNVPIEQISAGLASITKQNVPTAQAMTQMRAALVALIKPNKDMESALESLGYVTGQALLDAHGFQGGLEMLRTESGLTTGELTAAFGSIEAFGAVAALTGKNFQGAVQDLQAMTEASGAMAQAFETNNEGFLRSWESSLAILREVGFEIAEQLAPIVQEVAENFRLWYDQNKESIPGWVELGVKIAAVAAVIGPLLMVLGAIVTVLASSVTWVVSLGLGLGVLLNKFGFLKEAGEAFGEAFVKLMDGDVKGAILSAIEGLWEFIKTFNPFARIAETVFMKIRPHFSWLADQLRMIAGLALDVAKAIASVSPLGGVVKAGEFLGDLAFRAAGGPVSSGSPYIVGEQGPELFVPRYSGSIIPNDSLGGSSGQTINMTFNGVGVEIQSFIKNHRSQLARIAVEAVRENDNRRV